MIKPNIVIKAQNGSRIPYDKLLSISPTRCGSGPNDFAIVAIFDTDNKAYPKDVLFQGTKEECNEWLEWLDEELRKPFKGTAILDYPRRSITSLGTQLYEDELKPQKSKVPETENRGWFKNIF